jgi:hypothetical protein
MTDRELLEAAAMAAKLDDGWQHIFQDWDGPTGGNWDWNPLTDDGEAFRLAVKLRLRVQVLPLGGDTARVERFEPRWEDYCEPAGSDINAATRRAIVRAAAAMATEGAK